MNVVYSRSKNKCVYKLKESYHMKTKIKLESGFMPKVVHSKQMQEINVTKSSLNTGHGIKRQRRRGNKILVWKKNI